MVVGLGGVIGNVSRGAGVDSVTWYSSSLWDAATLRLILGGSAQPRDLQDLAAVCGDRDEEIRNWSRGPDGKRTISTSTRRIPILPADVIRTLPFGTAVLLARTAPPILLDMTPGRTGRTRPRSAPASPAQAGGDVTSRDDFRRTFDLGEDEPEIIRWRDLDRAPQRPSSTAWPAGSTG